MTRPPVIRVRVPAKINLELRVGPLRPDGFHDIATAFHAISLTDVITAAPSEDFTLDVTGRYTQGVPTDGTNLALRAARALAQAAGVSAGVHLSIDKSIPVAGGMAGGSADAAGALVACDALWDTRCSREDLADLAAGLGSDVPFSLMGGTAIGAGRGEQLTQALGRGEFHWVIAASATGLSTPAVYGELDRQRNGAPVLEPRVSDRLMQALRQGDPVALGASMGNDLQPAATALDPELDRTLALAREVGALGAIVSGSGPTVVALARDAEHALDLAVALTATGRVADVHRACGPVAGARLEPVSS